MREYRGVEGPRLRMKDKLCQNKCYFINLENKKYWQNKKKVSWPITRNWHRVYACEHKKNFPLLLADDAVPRLSTQNCTLVPFFCSFTSGRGSHPWIRHLGLLSILREYRGCTCALKVVVQCPYTPKLIDHVCCILLNIHNDFNHKRAKNLLSDAGTAGIITGRLFVWYSLFSGTFTG